VFYSTCSSIMNYCIFFSSFFLILNVLSCVFVLIVLVNNLAVLLDSSVLETRVSIHCVVILHILQYCKGVRCPPIFSLYNLINVGWL